MRGRDLCGSGKTFDSPFGLEAEGLPYVIDSWESMTAPATWQKRQNEPPFQNDRVRF